MEHRHSDAASVRRALASTMVLDYTMLTSLESFITFLRSILFNVPVILGTAAIISSGLLLLGICRWARRADARRRARQLSSPEMTGKTLDNAPRGSSSLGLSAQKLAGSGRLVGLDEDEREKEEVCPVCLGHYARHQELWELNRCGHRFHKECITEWFRDHSSCPTCNVDVRAPHTALSIHADARKVADRAKIPKGDFQPALKPEGDSPSGDLETKTQVETPKGAGQGSVLDGSNLARGVPKGSGSKKSKSPRVPKETQSEHE